MVTMFEYSAEAVDALYSAIETAAQNDDYVDMNIIEKYIHPGDFYLYGKCANGLGFTVNGLRWVEDGEIYHVILQPKIVFGAIAPRWEVTITVNDRDFSSSGRKHMIRKENRYTAANCNWIMPNEE